MRSRLDSVRARRYFSEDVFTISSTSRLKLSSTEDLDIPRSLFIYSYAFPRVRTRRTMTARIQGACSCLSVTSFRVESSPCPSVLHKVHSTQRTAFETFVDIDFFVEKWRRKMDFFIEKWILSNFASPASKMRLFWALSTHLCPLEAFEQLPHCCPRCHCYPG